MKKFLESLKYLIPVIGSFLGALGGQGVKEWRRIILPIILSILGYISIGLWGITLGFFGIFASMGHGIPDKDYPNSGDSGSTLGRFWWTLFNKNHLLADLFTRGTKGLGQALVALPLPLLKGNWLMYGIGFVLIMVGQTVFSWRGWGEVVIFGKRLLRSDLWNYGLVFTGYFLMLI